MNLIAVGKRRMLVAKNIESVTLSETGIQFEMVSGTVHTHDYGGDLGTMKDAWIEIGKALESER